MNDLSKVIMDIIELKQSLNIIEEDFTFEKAVDWYSYAIPLGLVEAEYENDKLIGYLEWVRLSVIPVSLHNIKLDYDIIKTAPVLLICNAGARDKKTLMALKNKVAEKNKDYSVSCWHRKGNDPDKFTIFKRKGSSI